MDILSEMYTKSLRENERNLCFWEGYLHSLHALDFTVYSEKLKVPVLVPIGNRILFRGELKHTNEITVALGADYFVKCSLKQADILKQHRIKVAQEKINTYKKEQEYLQNQMSFTMQHINENQCQEIIEFHTIEEDQAWREKHHTNVKAYIQNRKKEENSDLKDELTDEELWYRLEELELQEEMENELNDTLIKTPNLDYNRQNIELDNSKENQVIKNDEAKAIKEMENMKTLEFNTIPKEDEKLHLLQQVIDRQNELEEKLQEIKNRDRSQSKTEMDILSKLDELEQLEELEEEMDRLDDIIENEDTEDIEDDTSSKPVTKSPNRRVYFIDEDDNETLNLTFKHSDMEPNNEPYDPNRGILKPSDIYKAYSFLFENGTMSILKKSKYDTNYYTPDTLQTPQIQFEQEIKSSVQLDQQKEEIVIKDVAENHSYNKLQTETRPMSLFRKKRLQNKKY